MKREIYYHLQTLGLFVAITLSALASDLEIVVMESTSGQEIVASNVVATKMPLDLSAIVRREEKGARFRVERDHGATYRLQVSAPDCLDVRVFVSDGYEGLVEVWLVRNGVLSGHVTNRKGGALRGGMVMPLVSDTGDSGLVRFGGSKGPISRVNERGEFRLTGLPPGDYSLGVTHTVAPESVSAGATIHPTISSPSVFRVGTRSPDEKINVVVDATASGSLKGRVSASEGISPILVSLARKELPSLSVAKTVVNVDRSFEFKGVAEGEYLLFASGPSEGNQGLGGLLGSKPVFARTDVSIKGDTDLATEMILVQGKAVSFQLSGVGTAQPCASQARLVLKPLEEWGSTVGADRPVRSGMAEVIEGIPPTRFGIEVYGLSASCFFVGDPILDTGATLPAVVAIGVGTGGGIMGRVATNTDTSPVVVLWGDGPGHAKLGRILIYPSSDGSFDLNGIQPGRYRITGIPRTQFSKNKMLDESKGSVVVIANGKITALEATVTIDVAQ